MSIAITTMQVITTATTSVATIRITRTPKKMRMRKMMMKTKANSSQGDAQANELAVANGRDGISTQALARHDGRAYEVHPEVSFVHADGGARLPRSKSSWNGIHLRRRTLVSPGNLLARRSRRPQSGQLWGCA